MRKSVYFLFTLALSILSLGVSSPTAKADANNFVVNRSVASSPLYFSYSYSTDGKYQAFTNSSSQLFVSSNYGQTFTNNLSPGYDTLRVHVSPSGQYMIAAGNASVNYDTQFRNGGYAFVSSDFGSTWVRLDNSGPKIWKKIQISNDGTKIFGITECQYNNNVNIGSSFYSTNSGSSFTQSKVFPVADYGTEWDDFDMSSDGSKVFLAGNGQYLWSNIASGAAASWIQQTSSGSGIIAVRTNLAGTKVWIASNTLKVNTTSGSYTSWSQLDGTSYFNFDVSDDGKYILATTTDRLRVSYNSGASWAYADINSEFAGQNVSWSGFSVAISPDGQYAAADIGYIELYQSRLGADQVATPTATPSSAQIALSWSAPTVYGATISDYEIQQSIDGGVTWSAGIAHTASTSTSRTITTLTNGTSYSYRIAAVTQWGKGPFSASVTSVPATVPGAPTSVTGVRGNQLVDLTWTAPGSNGGHALIDYTIEYRAGAGSWLAFSHSASTSTSISVTGLTNGTSYTFRVSAVNDMGTSSASTVSSAYTPLGTPAAPTSFSATYGNAQASLSWTAPTDNGGSFITNYLVEYSSNGGSSWTTFTHSVSTTPSITITGLTNGNAYSYRVSAINAVGTGVGVTTTTAGSTLTTITLTRQSVGTANGLAFTTQPRVTLVDQFSSTLISDSTTVVTASISAGGTLVGTVTATASGGVATFSNLGISGTPSSTYTVTYSAIGVTPVTQSIIVTASFATISISLSGGVVKANKSTAIVITADTSNAGRVKFYANGKVIGGCAARVATTTATCSWKPAVQGANVRLTAILDPTSDIYANVTSSPLIVAVAKRAGLR
jgi:hypothetical protein